MSRYLVLLETHLPPPLQDALNTLVEQANAAGRSMYVTGATMRDVFAGLQARELDLVMDEPAKFPMPADVPVHLSMSAVEQYARPGGRPKLVPASIHDYLRSRDFSVNGIALSVTRASRGLLLDPANGVADIQAREIRALSSQTFLTRPARMLELLRLKVRLGLRPYPRTQTQFDEALASGAWRRIRPAELRSELEHVAAEPKALEVLQAWDEVGLLRQLLPLIAGEKLNTAGFAKLQKIRHLIPFGIDFPVDESAVFFRVVTDHLSPKERNAFIAAAGLDTEADWISLGRRVRKAERDLGCAAVHRPSQIYEALTKAGPTVTLLLAFESTQRLIQDRVRNYLTRYLPAVKTAPPGESLRRVLDARAKSAVSGVGGTFPSMSRCSEA